MESSSFRRSGMKLPALTRKVWDEISLLIHQSHPMVIGVRGARYWEMYQVLRRYLEKSIGPLSGKRILDLGCGISHPMSQCLVSDGASVVALDPKLTSGHHRSWRERIRHTVRHPLVYNRFLRALRFAAQRPDLLEGRPILAAADGCRLPLAAGSVDGAISFSVLEHVTDLDALLADLARVLKPNGFCVHQFHLYSSLTGGHALRWDLKGRPRFDDSGPWGHLKEGASAVSLNRLREPEYRELFERHFEICAWDLETQQGMTWLTADVERELADYDRDKLLRRSIFVVARPQMG